MSYTPEPGSLPARVCEWFRAHPDEELTGQDIARKFDLQSARGIHMTLQPAVLAHWLALKHGGIYAAGRLLTPAVPTFLQGQPTASGTGLVVSSQAARASSPFAKPERKKQLPPLDLSTVEVEANVPIPETKVGRKMTDWGLLFDRLNKPGLCSSPLPIERLHALRNAANKWAKENAGFAFTIRQVSPTHVRIWRVEAAS